MKKLLKVLLTTVLLLSVGAMAVSAEGSPEKPGAIGDWTAYDGEGKEYDHEIYELVFDERAIEDIDRHTEELRNTMAAVNAGTKSMLNYLKERGVSLPSNTSNVGMFMEIRDLIVRNKETKEKVDAYNVTATWEVPNLVEGFGQIYIYHHSTNNHTDELFKPDSVNYGEKAITATFKDLSPVSVVYIQTAQKPVDTAAKDYTGFFALAAVAAGLALIAVNKKEKSAA